VVCKFNVCLYFCETRSNLVKDENGHLLSYSHNVLNGGDYICQLLNIDGVFSFRWREMHTVEPLVYNSFLLRLKLLLKS
jgi:hypothetical protein